MVYALTVYEFITTFIPDYDSEPGLAAYKLARVTSWPGCMGRTLRCVRRSRR